MSNRNYGGSSIISILKAQNAANYYNRQQAVVNNLKNGPLKPGQAQLVNPYTGNFNADSITNLVAGQQKYYLKDTQGTTVISPACCNLTR
jgi:hypothetical protein